MGLTRSELATLKSKIKSEMSRRNGIGPSSGKKWTPSKAYGSMTSFAGSKYDFTHNPTKDGKIYPEYGQKTIDLLTKFKPFDYFEPVKDGDPIPREFSKNLISEVDLLSKEKFTGETAATIAARKAAGEVVTGIVPEASSCKAECSGLCVGSCISMCNGCHGTCTGTCGTGCAGGLMVSSH